ncbi:branched-chain amino acid ABC transporter ATPase/permease [Amycolatopsis mediterranei S699]|uniref:Fused ATPase and permease components of ABC-type branched-chain amino acid transport system n=2 Tax=Amycolatopsis mediterranei TaxID=33910 RepID=A0A0H3DF83_AMYMU|nr:branched-chain amino acid ABC transporter permease/ATP-binding protein [Amycolatopsis mediterranei]ADJ48872.1 fused ATPase and permease components of ABC-type branched-chain amino acid transport system [Amycolatopsis mediterranei U32]AEK45820.1 branched-chain amino acid ABC transporter ATPase/permease [Amycolatopsis mediterranei S699]AFO80580.1 branched-chain amino acid ABC transporter ATPase/permease [Amycolatopsis mediterranei S699]AGT87708.1 branched-chain amino acid ABC transporter ATPas
MSQYVLFLLLGLGNGAVFGALAMALVLTYRSSGVVNFATGAIALYSAYTYAFLRKGEMLVPIPGLPKTIVLGPPLGLVPAAAISVGLGAGFGVVLYGLVFRPLRSAPPVAKAVASIGVMLAIQAVLAARVGTAPVSVRPVLPNDAVDWAGTRIPGDRLWFAAVVVVLTVVLALVFRLTKFGLAARAAAETEKGALVSGLSPERIAVANWALSSAVAGLAGILIAPIVPLVPISYTLFIVPALAAALVGNFTALVPAVGAGLVIGMLQSELQFLQGKWTWLPQTGMTQLVPLAVIVVYLVVRGRPLPGRGAMIRQTLGHAPRPDRVLVPAIVSTGVGVVVLTATHGSIRAAVITSLTLGVISLSLVVVTGFAGQISLAQLTLAGVGAFSLSKLSTAWGIPFPFAPVLAAVVAMVIGVVIGLPALRIRGLPAAVVTVALAVALEAFWFRNTELNGGLDGSKIPPPRLFGLDLGIGAGQGYPRLPFALLCLGVLVLAGLGVAWLRRSRLGAAMLAVRANERSAAAAGVDVARTKIVAFAIGAFIAGLGGALLGYQQTVADAEMFTAIGGLGLFATAYLAGITALSGGVVAGVMGAGGLLVVLLDRALSLGEWYSVIMGIGLVLTVITNPEGLVGPAHDLMAKLRRRPPVADEQDSDALKETAAPDRCPAPEPGEVVLSLSDVRVRHGGVVAVDAVSFAVRSREIVGVIGPNGAGKTTLLDAISGYQASTGTIEFHGRRISRLKPHQRSRAGLGRTFQGIELYEDLSVEENVLVGETAARHGDRERPDLRDTLLETLHLDRFRARPARELSQGRRQLVSIARALAGRPRMLLLDEPAAGLDSGESRWLGERLRAVRDAGVTVLLVDHDMGLVLDVCDRIVVLDVGKVIALGTPAEIKADPQVSAAYFGAAPARAEVAR